MVKVYDFDVTVTSRHDEIDEILKQAAVEEILKLSRYHNHIIDGDLTIDKQNSSYKAEISLRIPGHTFIASHVDYNVNIAVDSAIEKTKKQLKKLKSKISDHRVSSPVTVTESSVSDEDVENEI